MKDKEKFLYLLNKYAADKCSTEEYDEFFSLVLSNNYDDEIKSMIVADYDNARSTDGSNIPPHIAQEIIRNIIGADKNNRQLVPRKRVMPKIYKWVAAACLVAAIIFFGYYFYANIDKSAENKFVAIIPLSNIIKENNTAKPLQVTLSDGSKVLLEPGSKIHYPSTFTGDTREVYLEGDAHFDVAHDPQHPFLAYCNNIVTKVLGTSFFIRTDALKGKVEVSVKSGRVQVFENDKIVSKVANNGNAIILTANQRVIYSGEDHQLAPTLIEKPHPINIAPVTDSLSQHLVFNQASKRSTMIYEQALLAKVFNDIETTYGIDVVVENTNLNNCVFTGDVTNKDLFVLLKIICLSTNADYEVMGTKILIKGKGCEP